MMERPLILSMQGYPSTEAILHDAAKILPAMNGLISHVKINDTMHLPDTSGSELCSALRNEFPDIGTFLDLKLSYVSSEIFDIISQYPAPDILSVKSAINPQHLKDLRREFPYTQIALFSVPLEISEKECQERYHGNTPAKQIYNDIIALTQGFTEIKPDVFPFRPFDMVMSPLEAAKRLRECGIVSHYSYTLACPTAKKQATEEYEQEGTWGVRGALEESANYVILEATPLKAGSKKGEILKENMDRVTEEVAWMKLEGAGHA